MLWLSEVSAVPGRERDSDALDELVSDGAERSSLKSEKLMCWTIALMAAGPRSVISTEKCPKKFTNSMYYQLTQSN